MFLRFMHIGWIMYQYSVPFNGWIIVPCMYIPHLFICSSVNGHLGCFHFLTTVNSVAVDVCVQVSLDFFYTKQEYISVYLTHCCLEFCHSQLFILLADTRDLAITILKNCISSFLSCLEVENIKKQKDLCYHFLSTNISCVSLGLSTFIYKIGINSPLKAEV